MHGAGSSTGQGTHQVGRGGSGHRAHILEMWQGPGRHFHGVTHLEQLLTDVGTLCEYYDVTGSDAEVLSMAAWFHDALYEPGSHLNERRSADLAADMLPGSLGEMVAEMTMGTVHHRHPVTFLAACHIDADLHGLATDAYVKNAFNFTLEYSSVNDESWALGRSSFLEEVLRCPTIFHTSWGAQFEQPARANMRRELDALKGHAATSEA